MINPNDKRHYQKEMKCPCCGEVSIFRKETDYECGDEFPVGKPVWECNLCSHQVARKIRKTK